MKKLLVIWNIVLTVLLLATFLTGCTGSNSRVDWAVSQIQLLSAQLGQAQSEVSQHTQQIQALNVQVASLQANMQSLITQINTILAAR
jgi:outer membrane murein-binding lipoprotein Lpp